jgi:hypothetical protein
MFSRFSKLILVAGLVAFLGVSGSVPNVARAQAFSGSCAAFRGSFTGTLTGYASPPTGTVQFRVTTACQVTLWLTAAITGTSNAATMTMTGLPYYILPSSAMVASQTQPTIVQDNGAFTTGCAQVGQGASAVITFSNTGACAGAMTSSAAKGLPAGWTLNYSLY